MGRPEGNDVMLMPIGRFARASRLSVKSLRNYHDSGLLPAAFVDPDSGYRYYRLSQANTAEAIRTLRSIDMPLDEILVVLESDEPDVIVPPVTVASLRVHTTIAAIAADLAQGFGRVGAAVAGPPAGPPLVIFHDVIDTETAGDIEICFPVAEPIEPVGDVHSRELDGGSMVTTVHKGPYDQVSPAYHTLTGWVQEHGHQFAGPPREIYLNDPTTVEPDELLTEVQWPIT